MLFSNRMSQFMWQDGEEENLSRKTSLIHHVGELYDTAVAL